MTLSTHKISLSKLAVFCCLLFMVFYRLEYRNKNEIAWDVFGYYLYLPATFVHDDPMLNDRTWVERLNTEKQLSGTVYQVTQSPSGDSMYFFLMGMAILYLPFFLIGHACAYLFGHPMDGFSEPYQIAMVFGSIVYTFIGLLLLRKLLLRFFSEKLVSLLLIILIFSTNATVHLITKNLETVNYLFFLMCWLLVATFKWHETHEKKTLIQIGIAITLMAMVKPSEVIVILIPLLWGVYSRETAKEKWKLIVQYKRQFYIAFAVCLLLASPQMAYWYSKTGTFIFDSYQNNGVGLDLLRPHIIPLLFSALKGWFVYTSIMILGVVGLYFFLPRKTPYRFALLVYFSISLYIISSWTEWWYGAAFSCRPIIVCYPILLIGMGFLLQRFRSVTSKVLVGSFMLFATFLNQFQIWQLMAGIYDPYRTTWSYYQSIFLQTKAPANADDMKLVYRSFEPGYQWSDQHKYQLAHQSKAPIENRFVADEFFASLHVPYEKITSKDHVWVSIDLKFAAKDTVKRDGPFMVFGVEYKGKVYGYQTVDLKRQGEFKDGTYTVHAAFLSPPIRALEDEFIHYIWNPGKEELQVTQFDVRYFERKK